MLHRVAKYITLLRASMQLVSIIQAAAICVSARCKQREHKLLDQREGTVAEETCSSMTEHESRDWRIVYDSL